MPRQEQNSDMYFDANGRLTERVMLGDQEVIVTYEWPSPTCATIAVGACCSRSSPKSRVHLMPFIDRQRRYVHFSALSS